MKVSVVIPVYNEEKYIKHCLDSLMNQTEKADEIIIVNNNSADRTVEIAKSYDVKIISENFQGIGYARNSGFNNAKGDIIVRCDADTMCPPDWLHKIKSIFSEDNKVIAVSGPGSFYDFPLAKLNTVFTKLFYFGLTKQLLGYYPLFGANMAIKKSAWEQVKNTVCTSDISLHEDMDLAIHIHKFGTIIYDPSLVIDLSARRFSYYLVEYPIRWLKTDRVKIATEINQVSTY